MSDPLLLLAAARPALLFLICQPGGVALGPTELKQVERLAELLAPRLEVSLSTRYETSDAGCAEAFAAGPAILMPSLRVYLEQAQKLALQPVAAPRLLGSVEARFHLWAQSKAPPGLAVLEGGRLSGTDLARPFLERVVFAGALPAQTILVPEPRSLRGLRALQKGEVAAILLDEAQHRALLGSPLSTGLEARFASAPLPQPPISIVPQRAPPGLAKALAEALLNLEHQAEGRAVLQAFGLAGFGAVDAAVYAPLLAQMQRKPR